MDLPQQPGCSWWSTEEGPRFSTESLEVSFVYHTLNFLNSYLNIDCANLSLSVAVLVPVLDCKYEMILALLA